VRGPYLAFADRAGARVAVAEYIEVFCNRTRLHSTLGYRTPFDAFTDYQSRAPSRCHF
jgi:putative transposase